MNAQDWKIQSIEQSLSLSLIEKDEPNVLDEVVHTNVKDMNA